MEVTEEDLVVGYVSQTAQRMKEVCEEALGGVLFIDEAYRLVPEHEGHSFGKDAINTLLKYMEDFRDQLVVIVAGYPTEMRRFLAANPGLASRFHFTLTFESATHRTRSWRSPATSPARRRSRSPSGAGRCCEAEAARLRDTANGFRDRAGCRRQRPLRPQGGHRLQTRTGPPPAHRRPRRAGRAGQDVTRRCWSSTTTTWRGRWRRRWREGDDQHVRQRGGRISTATTLSYAALQPTDSTDSPWRTPAAARSSRT